MQVAENITTPVKVGMAFVDPNPVDEKHVFFCRGLPTKYYFANGREAEFHAGRVPGHAEPAFVTSITGYIDELKAQIKMGHTGFFQKKEILTATDAQLDPQGNVKIEAVELYKQELLAAAKTEEARKLLHAMGVGTPEPSFTDARAGLAGITTTANIHQAAAESSSLAVPAGTDVEVAGGAVETNVVNKPDISSNPLSSLLKK